MDHQIPSSSAGENRPARRPMAPLLVLAGVAGGFALLFYQVMRPMLLPLFLAAVAAMMMFPLQAMLAPRVGNRSWLAAGLLTLALVAVMFGPIVLGVYLSFNELHGAVMLLTAPNESGVSWLTLESNPALADAVKGLSQTLGMAPEQVQDQLAEWGRKGEEALYFRTVAMAGDVPGLVVGFALFVLAVFFFLKDGRSIMKTWDDLSPLDSDHDATLRNEFAAVCRGVVNGTLLAAIAQGMLMGIGLFLINLIFGTGIGNWIFLLSLTTFVLSIVPFLGAIWVWLPLAVMLFLDGHVVAAVILAIYGGALVSQTDTVIRIWVLKGSARLHPLLVLVCVLGGIQLMGIAGAFVGPIVGAVLFALLRILKRELLQKPVSESPS